MNDAVVSQARKRPVNLTLNEDVVQQARTMTPNLSAVVETLLIEYVQQQTQARQAHMQQAKAAARMWNDFNLAVGSFADEYSTL
jgi:antitoxin CcdA